MNMGIPRKVSRSVAFWVICIVVTLLSPTRAATSFPTDYAVARIDFSGESTTITPTSTGKINSIQMAPGVYTSAYSGIQNWRWEQSHEDRCPTLLKNALGCWNAAHFNPESEKKASQVLLLQHSLYSSTTYADLYRLAPGMTVYLVAKWDGQVGNRDWQNFMGRGHDSIYYESASASSYSNYGWAMAFSEQGYVGLKCQSYFTAYNRPSTTMYTHTSYPRVTSGMPFTDTTVPHLFKFNVRKDNGKMEWSVDGGTPVTMEPPNLSLWTLSNSWGYQTAALHYSGSILWEERPSATSSLWHPLTIGGGSSASYSVNYYGSNSYNGAYGFNGKIFEMVFFQHWVRNVPDTVLTQTEQYLSEKYYLSCPPLGDVLSSTTIDTFMTFSDACKAGAASPSIGSTCTATCATGNVAIGSTGASLTTTDLVCNTGSWVSLSTGTQIPHCAAQCPSLTAPSNAGSCSMVRFDDSFPSSTYSGSPEFNGAWFYPRYMNVPPIPDSTFASLWTVTGGVLVGDSTSSSCTSSAALGNTLAINKYSFADAGSELDITFSADVTLTTVPSGMFAGLALRVLDKKNFLVVALVPGSSQTLRVFFQGSEIVGSRRAFTCPMSLNVAKNIKAVVKGHDVILYCGSSTTPVLTASGIGTLVPEGTYGMHVNGAKANFDNVRLTSSCVDGTKCSDAEPDTECSFSCREGYTTSSGSSARTCTSSGSWSGSDLVCRPVAPTIPSQPQRTVNERARAATLVGAPVTGTTAIPEQGIIWSIKSGDPDGYFDIASCSGQISVAREDLPATPSTRTLVIAGQTDGNAAAETTVNVVIQILDVNDAPEIVDPVTFSINENVPIGSVVGTLDYYDQDGDTDMTWKVEFGNEEGVFAIAPTTGQITTAKSVNFEVKSAYRMYVSVADPGGKSGGRFIDITVLDVDDIPVFVNDSVIYISEANTTVGATIGSLTILDEDPDELDRALILEAKLFSGATGVFGQGIPAYDPSDLFQYDRSDSDTLLRRGIASLLLRKQLTYDPDPSPADAGYPFDFRGTLVRAVYALHCTVEDPYDNLLSGWVYVAIAADVEGRQDATVNSIFVCDGTSGNALNRCLDEQSGVYVPKSKVGMSTAGGDWVAVQGKNFKETDIVTATYKSADGQLSYTATNCMVLDAVSSIDDSTYLVCRSVPGVGAELVWSITVTGSVALGPALTTSYAAPVVTEIVASPGVSLSALSTEGGEEVTIKGLNFGYSGMDSSLIQQYLSVRYGPNAMYVAVIKSVTDTQLVIRTVEGYGVNMGVSLTLGTQTATIADGLSMSYAAPVISSITVPIGSQHTLNKLDTVGAEPFYIIGTNFGPLSTTVAVRYGTKDAELPGGESATPHSYITGVECVKDSATPHRLLHCNTKPGVGKNHAVVVTVGTLDSTPSTTLLSYLPPVITSLSGPGTNNADTAGGQIVTISGSHFGPVSLNAINFVQYGNPALFSGSTITEPHDPLYAAENCVVVANSVGSSGTQIRCETAPGRGTGHAWFLRIGGQDAVSVFDADTGYGPPVIISFDGEGAEDAETTGGQGVTILGRNFGPEFDEQVKVLYKATVDVVDPITGIPKDAIEYTYEPIEADCSMPVGLEHTTIICETVEGAGTGLEWIITVAGQVSRTPTTSYGVPEIATITVYNGATVPFTDAVPSAATITSLPTLSSASPDGGDFVVIRGTNFGPGGEDSQLQLVRFGRDSSHRALNVSDPRFVRHEGHEVIVVRLPPSIGSSLSFTVTVADQISNPSLDTFSFATPVVHAVLPCTRSSATTTITVVGRNFGLLDTSADIFVSFGNAGDNSLTPYIPLSSRSPLAPTDGSYWPVGFDRSALQTVTFTLPDGVGMDRAVRVVAQPTGRPSLAVQSTPSVGDTTVGREAMCGGNVSSSSWIIPTVPSAYRSVFSYPDPVVQLLALDIPRAGTEEVGKAALYFLADVSKVRILRITGTDFGSGAGASSVARIVQILDDAYPTAGFTTSKTVIDSWSSTRIVVYTTVQSGSLRVMLRSVTWDGRTVSQTTSPFAFSDVSPSISGAQGVAGGFPTHGWTSEHNNAYIRLPIQHLAQALTIKVMLGDVECPVVAWNSDETNYDREVVNMNGALDENGHTPFQALVLRPQAKAELQRTGSSGANAPDSFYNLDSLFEWDIWVRLPAGPSGSNQYTGDAMPITVSKDGETTTATPVTISYDPPRISRISVWDSVTADTTTATPSREYCWSNPGSGFTAGLLSCATMTPVSRVEVPTMGAIVRLQGSNFGLCPIVQVSHQRQIHIGSPSTCGDEFSIGVGATALPKRSHTELTFVVPAGEGNGLDPFFGMLPNGFVLDVDVGGQVNSLPAAASLAPIGFSYLPPTVTTIVADGTTKAEIGTRGGKVRLTGRNFGAPASTSYTSGPVVEVFVGRTTSYTADDEVLDTSGPGFFNCTDVVRVSHTELTCMLEEGVGTHLDVHVSIAGVASSAPLLDAFRYAAPVLTSLTIEPSATDASYEDVTLYGSSTSVQVARAATVGGYQVTIAGSNFGSSFDNLHRCVFVAWPNRPSVGTGAALQANLRALQCDGRESQHGEGEVAAADIVSWTHESIVFVMPAGVGMRDVTIRVWGAGPTPVTPIGSRRLPGSQADLNGLPFWYANPVVTYFGGIPDFRGNRPTSVDIGTEGGTLVMVEGRNFGWETSTDISELQDWASAFQNGGLDLPFNSAMEGIPTAATMVSFYRGCISATVDLSGNYRLGAGNAFLAGEGRVACESKIGALLEDAIVSHTDSQIIFRTSEGLGVNREVYVDIVDGDSLFSNAREFPSNVRLFNYSAPEIEVVTPSRVELQDPSTRFPIMIRGSNFGPTGSTEGWSAEERAASVYINNRECVYRLQSSGAKRSVIEVVESGVVVPTAVLECDMESDVVGNKNLTVRVAGQSGFLMMTSPPTFHVVCDTNYYGDEGEECLPCPDGAECLGYDATTDTHSYPLPLPDYFNLNDTMMSACPDGKQEVAPSSSLSEGGPRDVCIVPCQPSYACEGNNYCAPGYKSEAPMYRCSSCADRFYRRSGECVKCPDSPWLMVAVFVILGLAAAGVGYFLNRAKINIALIAIGVDYFQVLAIFAMSRISWPPMIKELFHILSAFNLNIEITAPECSIPDIDYQTKWSVIMLLPLMAGVLMLLIFIGLRLSMLGRALRKWQHEEQWGVMVAGLIVVMYFLYLYITRNVLDIFNCVPTDPPDGNLYLQPVFEECGKPGGIQEQLMPSAIVALLVYVIGFPTAVGYVVFKYADIVRRDQLIRAMGFVRNFTYSETYPQTIKDCYQFRAKFSRLYYYFKPDYYYWILTIIGRKFFIAFCSLTFNTNPAFQLAAINLVIFISYTLQVRHSPYMAPQSYDLVLREWQLKVQKKSEDMAASQRAREEAAAGVEMTVEDTKGSEDGAGKHYEIWEDVKYMLRYKERRQRSRGPLSVNKADRTQILGILANGAFDYNTVETVLLFCAIVVTLGGIMFESGQLDSATYQDTRDAVTIILMVLIIVSIIYFFTVLVVEAHMLLTEEQRKKKLTQQKLLRSKQSGVATHLDLDTSDVQMEHSLFMASTARDSDKDSEMTTMEMDAILALEDMDSHTWAMVKDKLRAQQILFKEANDRARSVMMDSYRSSPSSAATTSNPLLVAGGMESVKRGRSFTPTLAPSGIVPARSSRSMRSSRRHLSKRPSLGASASPSASPSVPPPPPPST